MPIATFTPVGNVSLSAGPASANVEIVAGGTIALVTNLGQTAAFVAVGSASSLTATAREDLPVLPQQSVALGVSSVAGTYLAAVTLHDAAGLVVTTGN